MLKKEHKYDPGNGEYQKNLKYLTKLKVLHSLAVRPYSYQSLRTKTRIQGTRLRNILEHLVGSKVIISHKHRWKIDCLGTNQYCDARTSLDYYILNLDNPEVLRWLTDIRLDIFIKNMYRLGILRLLCEDLCNDIGKPTPNFRSITTPGGDNELFRIIKNMDYSFLPWLYLSDEEKRKYREQYFMFSSWEVRKFQDAKCFESFPGLLKFFDYSKFLYDSDYENSHFCDQIPYRISVRKALKICMKYNLSKFDILIHLSSLNPSQRNYLFIWNAIKDYGDQRVD